jgi:hypothetical protein
MQPDVVAVVEVNEHEHERNDPSCEVSRAIASFASLRSTYPGSTLIVFWWNCDSDYTRRDTATETIEVFFFFLQ